MQHPRETTFSTDISLKLDRLIADLDAGPRWPRRTVLRARKRWLERGVSAFTTPAVSLAVQKEQAL